MTEDSLRLPPAPSGIASRLIEVRSRVGSACARAGRDPAEVELVAVTKTVGMDEIRELARLGVEDVGENRSDALASKRAQAEAEGLRLTWHMIGRWQTNKVRRTIASVDVLHALDRDSLLEALAAATGPRADRPLPVLLEVNVASEASKAGYAAEDVPAALSRAREVPGVVVRGLMTMAPRSDDPEASRPVFRRLRELRDAARDRGYLEVLDLSMGMTQDFEVAVEEGATLIRVGAALFEDPRS